VDAQEVITQSVAVAGFAKILVDLVKMSPVYFSPNVLPILAFFFSQACAFLLAATNASVVFNRPTISLTILVGILATAGAIAITEAQKRANNSQP
jgi:hypothetical protein